MAECYDSLMLDYRKICAKILEAVTSQHIVLCWKSSDMLCTSDVPDLTHIYGNNIGNSAQDKAVANLLSLMKQRPLDEQAEFFIDSDNTSSSTNSL